EPIEDWYITQAQMFIAGNIAVEIGVPGSAHYYWEIYCLMGDPSLMIYFSQPPDPIANYQGLMPLGVATFDVSTDPYSYVAISKDGVLHGCAIADATGQAEVEMFNPITVPGEADVVITGQNKKPYIGTVNVSSPNGPYVIFAELTIDDSDGNNNGLVDFSEYILLDITLENLGSLTGTNLTATISSTDDNITIDIDTHNWPDIGVGATVEQTGAFAFTVEDLIEDQHVVTFDLEVTDGTDTWNSTFNITLHAPVLLVGNYYVDDTYGNNNGMLDPGENADIIILNTNEGGCNAVNTIASLSTSSGLVTITNATYSLETLAVGETAEAVFSVIVDVGAQVGDEVEFEYDVESTPYSANTEFSLKIGLIVEDFESGGFENMDWEFGGNADWVIDQTDPYEGIYSAKSGSISHSQTSSLLITIDVASDDQISFFRKVSSESGWDYLRFFIDNIEKGEWGGEVSWAEVSYPVTEGTHTFKWEYSKDGSVNSGSDCGWVDYIIFPAFDGGGGVLDVTASANPPNICGEGSSQLNAFAIGGTGTYTYEWTPATSLSDPNIQSPVATPTETTTYSVTVDDGENSVTDEVTVTVSPVPDAPVISQNGNILESSVAEGNQWYDSNGAIPGATEQTFEPSYTDTFYATVINEFGCESDPSNSIYFNYTGVIEISGETKVNIYPNPFANQFTLDYTVKSASNVRISIFNAFGQQIVVLEDNSSKMAGNHSLIFNAGNLEPGIYYCKIETDDYSVVKRIIHSK
ncbi:MAG: T9SS type A sorting domain-containing protein, partial [Bacteroidales bacterium]|nr:T9SS type A sorting domain-containing protein [Bacteroidales bacterium]